MSAELMLVDRLTSSVSITASAIEARDMALAQSALIGKVTNAAEQETAVAAQAEIHRIVSEVKKTREAVKRPVIDLGRAIDDAARNFCKECDEELVRLARMLGDFQSLEQAKARAAQQAKLEQLSHVEKDRATELAAATSHEQLDSINERYNDKAAVLAAAPAAVPARAEGQTVKPDYEITVTDIWLLAKSHPTCVKIEPRLAEIKALLNAGVKVAGVNATQVIKSGVRLRRGGKAIDV